MKQKKSLTMGNRVLLAFAAVIITALFAFGMEYVFQLPLLARPATQQGDFVISLDTCTLNGAPAEEAPVEGEELPAETDPEAEEEIIYADDIPEDEEGFTEAEGEELFFGGAAAPAPAPITSLPMEEEEEIVYADDIPEDEEGFTEEEAMGEDLFFSGAAGWQLLTAMLPAAQAEEPAEPGDPVYLYMDSMSLSIPYSGYVHELTVQAEAAASAVWRVTLIAPDGTSETLYPAFNASLSQDTVIADRVVSGIEIAFPGNAATVTGITIHNSFYLNIYRMLFVWLTALCVCLLVIFRRQMGARPEYAFLCVALCLGLFMSICLPPDSGLSFDDQIHAEKVIKLATLGHGLDSSWEDIVTMGWTTGIGTDAMTHSIDSCRDNTAFVQLLDETGAAGAQLPLEANWNWDYTCIGELTQSLGVRLARALGQPVSRQILLARVCNMLTYVLLCFFAIKVLKRFKYVMMCVALMPTPLFLACNLSYDPTINGLCYLGIALVLEAIMDRETRLTSVRGFGILFCLVLGAMTKVVYIPLLLLVLLLPRSKFETGRQQIAYKAIAMVILLAVLVCEVLLVDAGTVALQDDRSMEADTAAQMSFILAHPFTYLQYFFTYIWMYFTHYFLNVLRTDWAYVGAASNTIGTLSLMLLLFAAYTDNDPLHGQKLTAFQRICMLLTAGIVTGMVFTTMYLAYSPVGVMEFGGVQARYLLPVFPLLMMILSPNGVENRMNKQGYTLFLSLANLAIVGVMCWELILVQFYR